jgi:hypothetical protein
MSRCADLIDPALRSATATQIDPASQLCANRRATPTLRLTQPHLSKSSREFQDHTCFGAAGKARTRALADIVDRRRLLVAIQAYLLIAAGMLGILTFLDMTTAWVLLGFTFGLGVGAPMMMPA